MAESNLEKSLKKAQTLKVCEFCETNTNIEWKCINCDLWMCDNCKKKLHIKYNWLQSIMLLQERTWEHRANSN